MRSILTTKLLRRSKAMAVEEISTLKKPRAKYTDIFVVNKSLPRYSSPRGVRLLSNRPAIHEVLNKGVLHRNRGTQRSRKVRAWLALDLKLTNMLLDEMKSLKVRPFGTLAVLKEMTPSQLALAGKYFRTVFQPSLKWLPVEQLIRILNSNEPRDRIVCGMVDKQADNLLVYRGDLQPVVAPLNSFRPSAGLAPNFDEFEVIDWGNAVRFGEYEASADAIFYENDPEYRRRLRARRRDKERSFGASLRRLRLQRELRQT